VTERDRLPFLPVVDQNLVQAHARSHAELDSLLSSCDPAVARVFLSFATDIACAAIAGIPPSFRNGRSPMLLPVPRAFLCSDDQARMSGVHAGLQYVDSRLAMVTQGYETAALRSESPYVLHALAEGRMDNPLITNPGMTRATPVRQTAGKFTYPEPSEVRGLFDEAVSRSIAERAPACVRAAWLLFTTVFIHPFCDGNGRVSRLLYLLVSGEELPSGIDLGVAEQWGERLEAFQNIPGRISHLDGELDLSDLVAFVIRASVDGARLMKARIGVLEALHEQIACVAGDASRVPAAVLAVALRRIATVRAVASDIDTPYDETLSVVSGAANAGFLRRVSLPASRRTIEPPSATFALGPKADSVMHSVIARSRRANVPW